MQCSDQLQMANPLALSHEAVLKNMETELKEFEEKYFGVFGGRLLRRAGRRSRKKLSKR